MFCHISSIPGQHMPKSWGYKIETIFHNRSFCSARDRVIDPKYIFSV